MATLNDRVGDKERDRALQALGVHYAQGRLQLDEYEIRSDRVMDSHTRGELDALFFDLPSPHYDRGLAVAMREQEQMTYTPPQVVKELDPWDKPIGNGPLTLRKAKRIGWLVAIAWIVMVGPVLDAILPSPLVPFFIFAPSLAMIVLGVLMKPNVPRYRHVPVRHERGKYPY